jgi:hypothetical protein
MVYSAVHPVWLFGALLRGLDTHPMENWGVRPNTKTDKCKPEVMHTA